jgi:hypothetical protein
MSILYPVAETPEAALHAARGHAARAREAEQMAGGAVRFVTEAVGPAFATREAALDAYVGLVEDERPGRPSPPVEARWRQLRPVSVPPGVKPRPRPPLKPVYRDGRRWPSPPADLSETAPLTTLWRLSVSYWRIEQAAAIAPQTAARKLRRDATAKDLDAAVLDALARQPLRPLQPQRALDIGLFEYRPPDAPGLIIPDE